MNQLDPNLEKEERPRSRSRAGKVETSRRLQETARVLRSADSRGVTTREIGQFTGSEAVHSDIHALRVNGYDIERIHEGKTDEGNPVNRYFLRHEPEHLAALLTGRAQTGAGTPLPIDAQAGPETLPGQVGGGDYPLTEEELQDVREYEDRATEESEERGRWA